MAISISITFLILAATCYAIYIPDGETTVHKISGQGPLRIGFGSCYDEYQKGAALEENIMQDIAKENLDLWIWLGDFAYVDNKLKIGGNSKSLWERLRHISILQRIPFATLLLGLSNDYPTTSMREYWLNQTYMNPFYQQLRTTTPIVGIWDDHDYGVNDGDSRNPFRLDQKRLYLNYLDEPVESRRRTRGATRGIEQYYRLEKNGVRVLVALLDVRYEKTKLDTLSERQWKWIDNVLEKYGDQDDLILIGSGIQFMINNRLINAEHWKADEVKRLAQIISKRIKDTSKVIFLSGDVHHGQIIDSKCSLKELGNQHFVEITSSGMTHTCDRNIVGLCDYALEGNTPRKYQSSKLVVDFNYGLLQISKDTVEISLKGRQNKTFLSQTLSKNYSKKPRLSYCDNHVFERSVIIFEKLLYHIPYAMIERKNLFLLIGVSAAFFCLSVFLSFGYWAFLKTTGLKLQFK